MNHEFDNCKEHPLGILCKCAEYRKIVDKFIYYSIGANHYLLPKVNVESIASAKVLWIKNHLKLNEDITKPIILYPQEQPNINARNVDKIWMPFVSDLIPLKLIKLRL